METKRCSKCGEEKDISEFYKNKQGKSGLTPWCKLCIKDYREKNKDKIKETKKKYREKNKDRIKDYREKNKDRKKEWYKNNKDKIKEQQKEYRNSFILFNSKTQHRQQIGLYEEVKESIDGHLMCKCTYCGE